MSSSKALSAAPADGNPPARRRLRRCGEVRRAEHAAEVPGRDAEPEPVELRHVYSASDAAAERHGPIRGVAPHASPRVE